MPDTVARCELAPGFSISSVLTGLWQIADMEREGTPLDPDATAPAMAPYHEAGFTTFDMADHYGSAEIIAGRFRSALSDPESVQLLTKWVPPPGPISRETVRGAVERALDRLNVPRIDLLQFHAWNYADPAWLDGLFYLGEEVEAGHIRHLGLTNVDTDHLRVVLASGIPVVSNQVCYSLLDQRAAGAMTALCREKGVKLLAFGTVAGGFLTARWLGRPDPGLEGLTTWSQMKYYRFIQTAGGWAPFQALLETLSGIATRLGVSIANVACRYMLEQPAVGGIIIGARLGERAHIDDNRRLFAFSLDAEAHAAIATALAAMRPIPGDSGDEYRKPPFLTAAGDLSDHLESLPAPFEPIEDDRGTLRVFSGTEWEPMAGYCRAIRRGNRIHVSGTTATHGDRVIGGDDPAAQTHFVIDKIEGALQSLGARLADVVRTRIFVSRMEDWEAIARAHGRRFGSIQPVNTLVRADLIGPEYRVEIEAEAEV